MVKLYFNVASGEGNMAILHYSLKVRRWSPLRFGISLSVLILLLAPFLLLFKRWPVVERWYWVRCCLTYSTPEGSIAAEKPNCLVRLDEDSYRGERFPIVPFLHSRVSPNGALRLVAVEAFIHHFVSPERWPPHLRDKMPSPPPENTLDLEPHTYDPSILVRPNGGETGIWGSALFALGEGTTVQIISGQPDPKDASHFSVGYTVDGKAGVIEGYLEDDGTVAFRSATAPAEE